MEFEYTYLRTDFPGSQYNTTALQNEIRTSGLSPKYLFINTFANMVYVYFNESLTLSEISDLDYIIANHNTSYGIIVNPVVIEGLKSLDSTEDILFGTPSPDPLPTMSSSYSVITVYGQNGPNLLNVTAWSVTWNLNGVALNSFNLSTSNGSPSWWLNLIPLSTQNFHQSSPSLTLNNTNISNLDGQYWVNKIGSDFVMVSKSGTFSIYLSNSSVEYVPSQFKEKILLIDPITNELVDSGHKFSVFGRDFHMAQSSTEQTTTLRTYQNALSLNVEDLPRGRYRIGCSFRYSLSVTNNQYYARITLNGNQINEPLISRIPNAVNMWYNSFTFYEILEGDNEIILQYYGGSGTARISDMVIELWRTE